MPVGLVLIGSTATLVAALVAVLRRDGHRLRRRASSIVVLAPISLLGVVPGHLASAEPVGPDTTEERDPNDNCPPGFELIVSSGVSCVQERDTLPENGSISYTGTSICLDGVATFETRETVDGLPALGTGGRTQFPFLLSCDPAFDASADTDTERDESGTDTDTDTDPEQEAQLGTDVAPDGGADVVTDGFGDEQRRVVIGLGAGGAGLVVTIGVARALMRRWGMTPKQLLDADLRAPSGVDGDASYEAAVEIGPEGEGGYDDPDAPSPPVTAATSDAGLGRRSGGGVVHDAVTGRWISWAPGPDGTPVVVGGGGPDVGATTPRFQGYSAQDAPSADATPPVAEGFSFTVDPSGGLAATLSTGQPGDPFHATVRQSRRGRSLDLGLRPNDRVGLRYRNGAGDSEFRFDWTIDADQQLTITHEADNGGRTMVRHTVRF